MKILKRLYLRQDSIIYPTRHRSLALAAVHASTYEILSASAQFECGLHYGVALAFILTVSRRMREIVTAVTKLHIPNVQAGFLGCVAAVI